MNKLIEELAEQAEDYADKIVDQGGEFHINYTKKLADLIIRECVNTAFITSDGANPAYNVGRIQAGKDILEQFGLYRENGDE